MIKAGIIGLFEKGNGHPFSYSSIINGYSEKGYKKSYSNQKLSEMKREVVQNKTNKNFIMFNNTFFAKRNKTCKIGTKKIRYAAVCNAVQFAKKTRKNKKK